MLKINSIGKLVITGFLSFATPACDGSYRAYAAVGTSHARTQAKEIVSKCTIPGQPVSDCIKKSGVRVRDVCQSLSGAANYGCGEEFTRIRYTGKGL